MSAAVEFLIFALIAGSAPAENASPTLILRNATVLDGISPKPRHRATIVIRGGKIVRIGGPSLRPPGQIIDLAGRWVIPGLIDAHVHLNDVESSQRALATGVTTARSLGSDYFADVRLGRLHREGRSDLVDVLASGYQLANPPSKALLGSEPKIRALFEAGQTGKAVAETAALNAAQRLDVIKVLANNRAGLRESDPMERNLDDPALKSAVDEARRHKLPVAAHAHSDSGGLAAVLAGAATIEHGTSLSRRTLRLMQRRRVCLVPTISGWSLHWDGIRDNPVLTARARSMAPRALQTAAEAHRAGVRLIAGSDMSYGSAQRLSLVDEVQALVSAGMRPVEALHSATSIAAECLGIAARTGRVTRGLEADLLVVGQDPRLQLETLRYPLLIINDGVIVSNQLR